MLMQPTFPVSRPRRLRRTAALRTLVRETKPDAASLILPIFVEEGVDEAHPIASMPGVSRVPERDLPRELEAIARDGVRSVIFFGVSHNKDETGSDTLRPDGLVARMVRAARDAVPELVAFPDICFDEYTTHGHCGILRDGDVDNDATVRGLAAQAVIAADAGAPIVAPSAMMDGQVTAIRAALDGAGHGGVAIMSYSTKFASAMYGPFRAATGCDLQGDRLAYQMDPMNPREALRESQLDEAEGADILMVKPALPYLDVLARIRESTLLPLAAYQVSGEYAMIRFAAQAGALDEARAIRETLGSIHRAGADLILTYFAREIARDGW
jgi:porphobilinogen synthase